MTKRPETLETLMLTLQMLRYIPRGRKVTAKDLHEQLLDTGVQRDVRTVQRLLDMLSQNFDIERDTRSKPYGYRWKENAKALAVPELTPKESLLMQLAEDYLRNLLPTSLMRSLEPFFTQAKCNLGPGSNAQLEREWPKKVRVVATSQPLLPPSMSSGVFAAVSEALYANLWLEVDYSNAKGSRSKRKVMPLGLAQQGPCLYLVCRFEGFENERSLALHRMHAAKASTLGFARPPAFDLQKYDADGRFGFGNGQLVRIKFAITGRAGYHLSETPLARDQEVQEQADGSLRVSATLVDSSMLDRWLRGFGADIWDVQKLPVQAQPEADDATCPT